MDLSIVLGNLLNREVVFNNGRYYILDDNNELTVFNTNQAISLADQLMKGDK